MIIDFHTRVWDSSQQLGQAIAEQLRRSKRMPWDRPDASPSLHDEAMAPVDRAVILGLRSKFLEADISPEDVARYVQRDPDKYLGFAGIDPTEDHPETAIEEARKLGLVGVTMSPAAQGFHPADTRAMAVYEACESLGMPVVLETGAAMARSAKMEFAQPFLLDEVARTYPDLKLVLSSIGFPFIEQGLALITKHPQVYADLAELVQQPWQLYNALVLCHQHGVADQLLFGSNFPFCSPEKAIVTIYNVNTLTHGTNLPSIPRETLRSIIERDAITRLGLPVGVEAAEHSEEKAVTPTEPPADPPITIIRDAS